MFRDQSLIPTEAIRLAALGFLAEGDRRYGELVTEVRHLASRMLGPSLDALGPSLELLRYEGLVEPVDAAGGPGRPLGADTLLRLTDAGRAALTELLTANVRTPINDVSKMVVALKLRFLHHLPAAGQRAEIERLMDVAGAELARLTDLRDGQPGPRTHLSAWLDHEIAQAQARADWLGTLLARL